MTSQELLVQRARYDANRRWWGIAAVLGVAIFLNQNRTLREFWPLLAVIGVGTVYNFILYILAYHRQVSRFWSYLEIGLDLFIISSIVHFTGGVIDSPFFFLFPVALLVQTLHRNIKEIMTAAAGIFLACLLLLFLPPASAPVQWERVLDRALVLLGVAAAALVYTTVFIRELGRSRETLLAKERQLEEATQINEKLNLKIHTSTQKLEEANVMLVKKNLAMMALHEIYVAMNSTFNSQRLLNLVMDTAMSLLKATSGFLLLIDPMDKKIRAKVTRGLDQKFVRSLLVRPGEGLEGQVARNGREQLLGDLSRFPEYPPLSPDGKSKMCAPLRIKSKIVGVITIESSHINVFSKSDLELLSTLASQASEVLQNLELYEEMRNKANGLSLLFEIGKDISTILNLKRLFATILERSLQVMKARGGVLMIYDDEREQLVVRASVGIDPGLLKPVNINTGIAGWVYRNVRPVIIGSVANSPLYDRGNDAFYAGQSLIAAPLAIRRKVFGVICLHDREGRMFTRDDLKLLGALASQAGIAIENVDLYASIRRDYLNAIKALAAAVDAKDHYTHGHSNKVMAYAAMIAKELGLSEKEVEKIKYGALLHDVGKIGISETVLNKPSKLTPKEFDTIAMHPILGVSIVQNIESLKDLIPIILYHHERYSGGGYPEGIAGNSIPLGARIVGVADSWDVMTSDRAYRKALPLDVAIAELKKCSGTQFDPEVVNALMRALERNEKIETFKIEEEQPNLALDEEEINRLTE